MKNMFELEMTCCSCPEQYDVYLDGKQVGYLRLRHGRFTAECPDALREVVYTAHPAGDGRFEDDEREHYLTSACLAIKDHLEGRRSPVLKRLKNTGLYKITG